MYSFKDMRIFWYAGIFEVVLMDEVSEYRNTEE